MEMEMEKIFASQESLDIADIEIPDFWNILSGKANLLEE